MYLIVEISGESYDRIQQGRSVVGQIKRDEITGILTLKAFLRHGKPSKRCKVLCQLPNGKLSESEKLYRLYVAVNKLLDVDSIDQVFDNLILNQQKLELFHNVEYIVHRIHHLKEEEEC